jgi:hypothetical protein
MISIFLTLFYKLTSIVNGRVANFTPIVSKCMKSRRIFDFKILKKLKRVLRSMYSSVAALSQLLRLWWAIIMSVGHRKSILAGGSGVLSSRNDEKVSKIIQDTAISESSGRQFVQHRYSCTIGVYSESRLSIPLFYDFGDGECTDSRISCESRQCDHRMRTCGGNRFWVCDSRLFLKSGNCPRNCACNATWFVGQIYNVVFVFS